NVLDRAIDVFPFPVNQRLLQQGFRIPERVPLNGLKLQLCILLPAEKVVYQSAAAMEMGQQPTTATRPQEIDRMRYEALRLLNASFIGEPKPFVRSKRD